MQVVAPAGSFAGLAASINGGADAVYLGMPNFGARAKAENFDEAALKTAIEYAHLFGVKVFVTLNTLIKDAEIADALNLAEYAHSVGADAAIVQDIRLIRELKRKLPHFTLHASTQMGIHNKAGAETLKDLGISRAVLARETLLSDIEKIAQTGIEIEFFVQGALCVCFSGNCYFSSLASSYSGNRGKCMQLCRKPYEFNNKTGYYLSAKDIYLYEKLDILENAGVSAIKIEGRLRSAEYAYIATRAYKSPRNINPRTDLMSVFNRGDYCSAYLENNAQFNIIYPKSPANIGVHIGKLTSAYGKNVAVSGFVPHKKDGFKVMHDGKELCGASVRDGKISADGSCRIGDELRRTFDGALSDSIKTVKRKIDVDVNLVFMQNEQPTAIIRRDGKVIATAIGEFVPQPAKTHGLTVDEIVGIFEKVSDYPFSPEITVTLGGSLFASKSMLNEFRRSVYKKTYDAILDNYIVKKSEPSYNGLNYNRFTGHGTMLMIDDITMLSNEILSNVDYIVINPRDYAHFDVPNIDKPILLFAPIAMRGDDSKIISSAIARSEISGVISNNLYTLSITDKPILLGTGHNIIGRCEYPHITSYEADTLGDGFVYAFGYAPVMTLCHCPYFKCKNCSGNDRLKDANGRVFLLRRYKAAHCYWQILNCVPHCVNVPNGIDRFIDGTACNGKQILAALNGTYNGEHTRGNIGRGLK